MAAAARSTWTDAESARRKACSASRPMTGPGGAAELEAAGGETDGAGRLDPPLRCGPLHHRLRRRSYLARASSGLRRAPGTSLVALRSPSPCRGGFQGGAGEDEGSVPGGGECGVVLVALGEAGAAQRQRAGGFAAVTNAVEVAEERAVIGGDGAGAWAAGHGRHARERNPIRQARCLSGPDRLGGALPKPTASDRLAGGRARAPDRTAQLGKSENG